MIQNITLDEIRNILLVLTTVSAIFIATIKYFFNIPLFIFTSDKSFQFKEFSALETVLASLVFFVYVFCAIIVFGVLLTLVMGEKINQSGTTPDNIGLIMFLFLINYIIIIVNLLYTNSSMNVKFYTGKTYYKKRIYTFSSITAFFSVVFEFITAKYFIEQINNDARFSNYLNLAVFSVVYIGVFIVSCGIFRTNIRINRKEQYEICLGNNETKKVKMCIELGEFYLIYADGCEISISKKEVKKVSKKIEWAEPKSFKEFIIESINRVKKIKVMPNSKKVLKVKTTGKVKKS